MTSTRPWAPSPWPLLFFASGATSLVYEIVWMRRLGLYLGGDAVSAAVTIGAFMAGLALGSAVSDRFRPHRPGRAYAWLECSVAIWALAFPFLLEPLLSGIEQRELRLVLATAMLLPPTTALGATWPLIARSRSPQRAAHLYAANTTGAVIGALVASLILLPTVGVRNTELMAVLCGVLIAAAAWSDPSRTPHPKQPRPDPIPRDVLVAVTVAGFTALGLEVLWFRIAAVALGATVQTIGLVLATFLATVAAGAWLGERWPANPRSALPWALGALGALALIGAGLWGQLPYALAAIYRVAGPSSMLPASALLAIPLMGCAPVASGVVFSLSVRTLGPDLRHQAGRLYAANTIGCILGAWCCGLWALPSLEVHGAVVLFALASAIGGAAIGRRVSPALPALILVLLIPGWDARLFAVGVHLRVSDFVTPTAAAVTRFVDEGWDLVYYDHGPTAAVAVGRAQASGNLWLSINGKVDASTGDDMPTQELSGSLPLAVSTRPVDVMLVGLASGITAGAILRDARVQHLTVLELEPAVVNASRWFDPWSASPLDDPRTTLIIEDARGWLSRTPQQFDVIVSEPSNPWITGVSNLFTKQYWELASSHLRPDGVMCQWIQLYGMGAEEFRALIRTFTAVFPETWLFETIPGSDILLIGANGPLPVNLPLVPTLDPTEVLALGGHGWHNTDDRPRVEWSAPRHLHYATGARNAALIEQAKHTERIP